MFTLPCSLKDHVPLHAEVFLPPHRDIVRFCVSQEFLTFSERMNEEGLVSLVPSIKYSADSPLNSTPASCSFKFTCHRKNGQYLSTARNLFEQLLATGGVLTQQYYRTDKWAGSFPDTFALPKSNVLSSEGANGTP